jgi:cellulose biosynthesis protein BcsQ
VEPYPITPPTSIIPETVTFSTTRFFTTPLSPATQPNSPTPDPPGYWGAHARNAVFAADAVIIPATCSRIDFAATQLYFEELKSCEVQADIQICVNCYSNKTNLPGIYDEYKAEFGEFLMSEPIPYIASLKKLTGSANYVLNPAVKAKLQGFVRQITGGQNA